MRVLQLGRICGVHLIISSQQTDRKSLPDKIKNAIPTKISFALRTKSESKYIFDCNCAEHLTTVGDMLYHPIGSTGIIQIKSCCVEDDDVKEVIKKLHNLEAIVYKDDNVESSKEIEEKENNKFVKISYDIKHIEELLKNVPSYTEESSAGEKLDKAPTEEFDSNELPSEISNPENEDNSESKIRSLRNIFNNKKVEKKEDFETDLKNANNKIKKKKRKVFSLKHGGTIVLSVGILLFAVGFLLIDKIPSSSAMGGNPKLSLLTAIITTLSFILILIGLILIKRKHENKFKISKAEKELNDALSEKDILLRKNYKK